MEKCLKRLYNGDTLINERICLMIKNSILLTEHHGSYNFPGGKLPTEYLEKKIGLTTLKELREELGIMIDEQYINHARLISWYYDNNNCLRILIFFKIKIKWIKFVKSSHVWESKSFTLIPIDNNLDLTNKIGHYLEKNIRKINSPCVSHIKITSDKIIGFWGYENSTVKKNDNNYYVKLIKDPKLNESELKLLRDVNKRVTGYDDTKFIYDGDFICKYKYVPFDTNLNFTVSYKFNKKIKDLLDKNLIPIFRINVNYVTLIDYIYNKFDRINEIFDIDEKNKKVIKYIGIIFDKISK